MTPRSNAPEGRGYMKQEIALMGHAPKGDRGKYREHDVGPYLPAIAAAVRAALGADPAYVRALA